MLVVLWLLVVNMSLRAAAAVQYLPALDLWIFFLSPTMVYLFSKHSSSLIRKRLSVSA